MLEYQDYTFYITTQYLSLLFGNLTIYSLIKPLIIEIVLQMPIFSAKIANIIES